MEPWTFDSHLLCLKEIDPDKPLGSISFDSMVIWMQVHDLPMGCLTREMGELLGARVGEVIKVDVNEMGDGWGECLRIRVRMCISHPIRMGTILNFKGQKFWLSFRYERLPNFCFGCGRVGHSERECKGGSYDEVQHSNSKAQYRTWLRAPPWKKQEGEAKGSSNRGPGRSLQGHAVRRGEGVTDGNGVGGGTREREEGMVMAERKGGELVVVLPLDPIEMNPGEGKDVAVAREMVQKVGTGGTKGLAGKQKDKESMVEPSLVNKKVTWKRRARGDVGDSGEWTGMVEDDVGQKRKLEQGDKIPLLDVTKRVRGMEGGSKSLIIEAVSAEQHHREQ